MGGGSSDAGRLPLVPWRGPHLAFRCIFSSEFPPPFFHSSTPGLFQAASPDEAALVRAAQCLGFEFLERTPTSVTLSVFGVRLVYSVLATNEFTSSRKRMSVLVRRPNGTLCLFCKGADNVILPNLSGFSP